MKCPSCSAQLKRRERGGYTCSKCKQPFALDPKLNALGLNDLRLNNLDRSLSDAGKLRYTPEQLFHAAAAKVVAAQQPFGVFPIVWVVLAAFAAYVLLTNRVNNPLPGVLLAAGVVVLAIFVRQRARSLPFYRKLPIDQRTFKREILGRWRDVYGGLPPGMLAPEHALPEVNLSVGALRGALVCPDESIHTFLAANGLPTRLGLALLPAGLPFTAPQEAHLAVLRAQPELPLYVLHDASPTGCLLGEGLRGLLGLDSQREVIDLGLNPRDVRPQQIVLGEPPDPGQIEQLRTSGTLQETELNWLAAGQIAPLAGVPPKRLIALVEHGLRQSSATPVAEAQQVGFMSWPV